MFSLTYPASYLFSLRGIRQVDTDQIIIIGSKSHQTRNQYLFLSGLVGRSHESHHINAKKKMKMAITDKIIMLMILVFFINWVKVEAQSTTPVSEGKY